MKRRKNISLLTLLLLSICVRASDPAIYTQKDSLLYAKCVKDLAPYKGEAVGDLILRTAKYFVNTPYVASTLESEGEEALTINLHQFDCTTFVENCIALAQVIQSGDYRFENYTSLLQAMRYRNGQVAGYTSRLHYTSDWITANANRGLLENKSVALGGKCLNKPINYMTSHPQYYKQLNGNWEEIKKLKEIEYSINQLTDYCILPKASIAKIQHEIRNADILVFATNIVGLDYSHIAIAYHEQGVLKFIHASSTEKKVVIEKQSLISYTQRSKKCSGISILRILPNHK